MAVVFGCIAAILFVVSCVGEIKSINVSVRLHSVDLARKKSALPTRNSY